MSNLDYKVRIELRHELRALQKRIGITAVYVTHDREEALTLADRIAVLDAGRVVQYGAPEADLSPAGLGVRRRLHGRRQCHRADARNRRRACRRRRPRRRACHRAFPQRRGAHRRGCRRRGRRRRSCTCRARSSRRCTSGRAIVIACAPTARTSGRTLRIASTRARPWRSSSRATRCCCFRARPPRADPGARGNRRDQRFTLGRDHESSHCCCPLRRSAWRAPRPPPRKRR